MSRGRKRRNQRLRELGAKTRVLDEPWTCLLAAEVVEVTPDTIIIHLADEEYDLPKSQVVHPADWKVGRSGNITVRTTLARELRLVE